MPDVITGPKTIKVKGEHYQMGRQHGHWARPLRPQITAAMAACFAQLERDGADRTFEALVEETWQLLQAQDPATIALIRGLADGLELDFSNLLRYNLVAFLRDALTTGKRAAPQPNRENEGCTTWAAASPATTDNRPILVKNRDYRREHLPLQVVVQAEPAQGYRYTFVTSAGSPGVFVAGINEAGLAVADTHVSSTDIGPGLPTYALSMHLLEEQCTVREALAYLQTTSRLGRNNLILADARGDLAVFEIGHRRCGVREASAGLLVNTNHFTSPAMQPSFVEIEPSGMQGNSLARFQKVEETLTGAYGRINTTLAMQLMAAHAGPLASICRHPSPLSNTSTIAGMIFLPAQRQVLFCHGQPCRGSYQIFSL